MWSYRFNHVRKQEEINLENKKDDRPGLKKITIVEVPYQITKKYLAAHLEKKEEEPEPKCEHIWKTKEDKRYGSYYHQCQICDVIKK